MIGIVRPVDDLGRVVIPKEIRKSLNIKTGDKLQIWAVHGQITLKPRKNTCVFCGDQSDREYNDLGICDPCMSDLVEIGIADNER